MTNTAFQMIGRRILTLAAGAGLIVSSLFLAGHAEARMSQSDPRDSSKALFCGTKQDEFDLDLVAYQNAQTPQEQEEAWLNMKDDYENWEEAGCHELYGNIGYMPKQPILSYGPVTNVGSFSGSTSPASSSPATSAGPKAIGH